MEQPSSELVLFESICKGDKKAFDTFFEKYYSSLCAYAVQFVDLYDSEEIVQDVMVWLWENREIIVVESSLVHYIFRAVRNKCINHLNKKKIREQVHLSILNSPRKLVEDPDFYIVEELIRKIEEALQRLPETYREAFVLNRVDGKTYKEIAELLHVSPKTIDYRLQQALKILRVELKDYLPLLIPLLHMAT